MSHQIINPTSTVVSGKRRLNVVFSNSAVSTEMFIMLGNRKVRTYSLNQHYRTLPVFLDGDKVVYDGDSAIIDGKVYDINKSGSKGAYCLSVNDTERDATPVRNINVDGVLLPINQYGDVILAATPPISPLEIVDEDVVLWMGRPMRIVLIGGLGTWSFAINI